MCTQVPKARTALVLAAGMGSRIRAVAGDLPKPLIAFAERPILAHNLAWLARSGITKVYINLHYQADQIRAAIADGSAYGLDVEYVYEPQLLGTAGALKNIDQAHTEPMWVVYGDNVVRCDLEALWRAHVAAGAEASLALFDPASHANTGIAGGRVALDDQGRVAGFIEGPGEGLVNAGVYVIEPKLLELVEAGQLVDFGRDVFPAALAQNRRLHGHVIEPDGFCLGLDTPESFSAGLELLASGRITL